MEEGFAKSAAMDSAAVLNGTAGPVREATATRYPAEVNFWAVLMPTLGPAPRMRTVRGRAGIVEEF